MLVVLSALNSGAEKQRKKIKQDIEELKNKLQRLDDIKI